MFWSLAHKMVEKGLDLASMMLQIIDNKGQPTTVLLSVVME